MNTMLSERHSAEGRGNRRIFHAALKTLQGVKGAISDVRGAGLLIGVELNGVQAGEIVGKLLQKGFVAGTAAGNVLRLLPPLIIEKSDCDAFVAALDELL